MILLEMPILQHVRTKSVLKCELTKIRVFKKCLLIHFRKKITITLFGGDGYTHCFARKTSRDCGEEKSSPFLKKYLRQSQPSTPEPVP